MIALRPYRWLILLLLAVLQLAALLDLACGEARSLVLWWCGALSICYWGMSVLACRRDWGRLWWSFLVPFVILPAYATIGQSVPLLFWLFCVQALVVGLLLLSSNYVKGYELMRTLVERQGWPPACIISGVYAHHYQGVHMTVTPGMVRFFPMGFCTEGEEFATCVSHDYGVESFTLFSSAQGEIFMTQLKRKRLWKMPLGDSFLSIERESWSRRKVTLPDGDSFVFAHVLIGSRYSMVSARGERLLLWLYEEGVQLYYSGEPDEEMRLALAAFAFYAWIWDYARDSR